MKNFWRFLGVFLAVSVHPAWSQVSTVRLDTRLGGAADSIVRRDQPQTSFAGDNGLVILSKGPLNPQGNTDSASSKAYVRFNRAYSLQYNDRVATAKLLVTLKDPVAAATSVLVYGLQDDATQFGSPLLEGWNPANLNWLTAPANNKASPDGNDIIEGDGAGRATRVGTISIPAGAASGTQVAMTEDGTALVDFLNADKNSKVTFILALPPGTAGEVHLASAESTGLKTSELETSADSLEDAQTFPIFISLADDGIHIYWSGGPTETFRVQYRNTMETAWSTVPGTLQGNDQYQVIYIDPQVGSVNQRFYRVSRVVDVPPDPQLTDVVNGVQAQYQDYIDRNKEHEDAELADFDEPMDAPGAIAGNPGNTDVILDQGDRVVSSIGDFGEDGTAKTPLARSITSVVDPTWDQGGNVFDVVIVVRGGQVPDSGLLLQAIQGVLPVAQNNVQTIAAPVTDTATGLTKLSDAATAAAGQVQGNPTADQAQQSAVYILKGHSLTKSLYNNANNSFVGNATAVSKAATAFSAAPGPDSALALANALGETPQAIVLAAPTAAGHVVTAVIDFTDPLFGLPGLQYVKPPLDVPKYLLR